MADCDSLERLVISGEDLDLADSFAKLMLAEDPSQGTSISPLLQALSIALVVSYWRPFSCNRDAGGKAKALDHSAAGFTAPEEKLHRRMEELRDKEYAHSDSERHDVRFSVGPEDSLWCSRRVAFVPLTREQVELLRGMIRKLQRMIGAKMAEVSRRTTRPESGCR